MFNSDNYITVRYENYLKQMVRNAIIFENVMGHETK